MYQNSSMAKQTINRPQMPARPLDVASSKERDQIAFSVVVNDFRVLDSSTSHAARIREAHARYGCLSAYLSSQDCGLFQTGQYTPADLQLRNDADAETFIIEALPLVADIPGVHPLGKALALNQQLANMGFLPLVHFAFDEWWSPRHSILQQMELSLNYLLRLVGETAQMPSGKFLKGGFSHVRLDHGTGVARKFARNMAARMIVFPNEIEATWAAIESGLAGHVPEILGFAADFEWLDKTLILGTSGKEIVQRSLQSTIPAVDQIESVWKAANKILAETGINLDIHPGNFIFDRDSGKWWFVDLGPMPCIGSEYFTRSSFEAYFEKCWLSLPELMQQVPIRSTEIGFAGPAPAGFFEWFTR